MTILNKLTREQLITVLELNDGNGTYSDADQISEGWKPLTLSQLHDCFHDCELTEDDLIDLMLRVWRPIPSPMPLDHTCEKQFSVCNNPAFSLLQDLDIDIIVVKLNYFDNKDIYDTVNAMKTTESIWLPASQDLITRLS